MTRNNEIEIRWYGDKDGSEFVTVNSYFDRTEYTRMYDVVIENDRGVVGIVATEIVSSGEANAIAAKARAHLEAKEYHAYEDEGGYVVVCETYLGEGRHTTTLQRDPDWQGWEFTPEEVIEACEQAESNIE
jgi:hypothetical protein